MGRPASRKVVSTPEQFITYGELLKFLRLRAGLTQLELSIAVGYSESQISRLEQNQRAPDEAAVAARYIPALHLESDREWAARLLELAAAAQATNPPEAIELQVHTPPHNLPTQLTSFVGRDKEMADIKRLFAPGRQAAETVRLLTLTGPGGTGKTRLALRVAFDLLELFPDGTWWVELAPLADPALVPQAVATALGVREVVGSTLLATLADHLQGKKVLLMLDNCEHIVQASAHFAETLLRTCPSLRILASSREILGVEGERSFYVPSLSTPVPRTDIPAETLLRYEAVRLFVERAAVASPTFVLTDANGPAVAQLCYRLDGIPLAIELSAARLRMLTVDQIAARLDDRFRLLTGGSRTALPRHQTLQALIDWSYELLTAGEQTLLRRLAVFAGGWMLDGAEAVGAGGEVAAGAVLDLLAHLIDKSLVQVEDQRGTVRYRMLETIRQYALAKLAASGEADAVRHRHAEYYLAIAEVQGPRISVSSFRAWLDRLELDHDDLRAALAWSQSTPGSAELGLRLAAASGNFWYLRVHWSEGRSWLERALVHADAKGVQNSEARARLLFMLGTIIVSLTDFAAGRSAFDRGLKLFRELGDSAQSARLLERLGWLAREQGDVFTARLRLEESLKLSREVRRDDLIAWASITLAEVAIMLEDPAWATALAEEGLRLFRSSGIALGVGFALNHLGHAAQIEGDYARAVRLHEESLLPFRELGPNHLGIAWAFQGLGETALAEGDALLARTHFTEALRLFKALGDRAGIAWCLAGLAGAAAGNEEPERAARLWGAAEALRQSIGARQAPAARATRERLTASARAQLGDTAFDAAWAEGQAALSEQVITDVLRSDA